MELTAFLTTNGLTLAVLLVWAHLWLTIYQIYKDTGQPVWSLGLGLLWLYAAVLASVLSLALTVFGSLSSWMLGLRLSIGLFGFSVTMAFFVVIGSLFALARKMGGDDPIGQVWEVFLSRIDPKYRSIPAVFIGLIILAMWLITVPVLTEWSITLKG